MTLSSTSSVGSVLSGTSPSLCAMASSAMTDVFLMTSTVSTAYTGMPLRQMRLRALAYWTGTPLILRVILLLSRLTTSRDANARCGALNFIKV